jgi:hypothetical protein
MMLVTLTLILILSHLAADLSHLRAVPQDKHDKFAEANGAKCNLSVSMSAAKHVALIWRFLLDMFSYFVSAKTGDNVNSTFYRVID